MTKMQRLDPVLWHGQAIFYILLVKSVLLLESHWIIPDVSPSYFLGILGAAPLYTSCLQLHMLAENQFVLQIVFS